MIERIRLATRFPVGPSNVYLLPGPTPALVDCGMDFRDNQERLAAAIDRVLGGRVELLLLTHAHVDHIGLAGWVRRHYGCRVLIHPADRRMAEDYPGTQTYVGQRYAALFAAAGFPEPLCERARSAIRDTFALWRPLEVDGVIEEGDELFAGDARWRVTHHPGHSPGLVCFTRADGVALAGDLLIPDLTTIAFFAGGAPERGLGLANHLASLEKLRRLAPRRVGPGHRGWIEDPAAELDRQFAAAEQRLAEVAQVLGPTPRSPWELVPDVFGELPDEQGWLALSDLLGALELLEQRGQAARRTDAAGRWLFVRG